ncbi:hypothetical protein [Streptomyces sp. NPDC059874]|uniref:hypothetical protein n=1 Tax=Streptomyces sp. NPDC059874 TaxID=3346983 RepID=UPI0036538F78
MNKKSLRRPVLGKVLIPATLLVLAVPYWTAAIHAGGSPSPNTYSDVWALCLTMHPEHRG